ncbi:uncharacterized protein LOC111052938 [Nilaparvata lugens]|uniref:uncharacterized protein LOC111052938 n=1 Tax=Nilaparvata lugens TaxID=108931 RepID=UPI00193E50E0|nr:uncharacterized protein LOC111052938 [Nilaparvata lugens]
MKDTETMKKELDEFDDSYTDKDYNPLKDKGYSSDDEPMDHSYSRPIRTRARDYADTMPGPSSRTPASASLPGSSSHTPATPELSHTPVLDIEDTEAGPHIQAGPAVEEAADHDSPAEVSYNGDNEDTDAGPHIQAGPAVVEAADNNSPAEISDNGGEVQVGCQEKPFKPRKRQRQ